MSYGVLINVIVVEVCVNIYMYYNIYKIICICNCIIVRVSFKGKVLRGGLSGEDLMVMMIFYWWKFLEVGNVSKDIMLFGWLKIFFCLLYCLVFVRGSKCKKGI